MGIFDGFDPYFGHNGTPLAPNWFLGVPIMIWRHNRNFHFFAKNWWPRCSRKFELWGMVVFYGFEPFFYPMGPHWPQDGPKVVPHRQENRWPRSSRKFGFWGTVIFTVLALFWNQWDPIGPKMDPRGSPAWFGAITVNSIYFRKIDDRGLVENSNFGAW